MSTAHHARISRSSPTRAGMTGRLGLGLGSWALVVAFAMLAWSPGAVFGQGTVSVTVSDDDGFYLGGFHWLLQEDTMFYAPPGVKVPSSPTDPARPQAMDYHISSCPVIASGAHTGSSTVTINVPDPNKHYFVSVLPDDGLHTMSGRPIAPGDTTVDIKVQNHPVPTAQIAVLVFHDNLRLNNAPDLGEPGFEGWRISLEDVGGGYGATAAPMANDAFGNPLGTEYDESGNVTVLGEGIVRSGPNGIAHIKNLAPGKYGVIVHPPTMPAGQEWIQTATIEGKKFIDVWVKPNEPQFFVEFGPPGFHAFLGFIQATNDPTFMNGNLTINGRVVNNHMNAGPFYGFNPGHALSNFWVGINSNPLGLVGQSKAVYAQPVNDDGTFSIPNVPTDQGDIELVFWDTNLDYIFSSRLITAQRLAPLTGVVGATMDLEDVLIFAWFGRMLNTVYNDLNQNGVRDQLVDPLTGSPVFDPVTGAPVREPALTEQLINIRFRDGTIYQSAPTDLAGEIPLEEVFPFFHWLVAEVDFARYKATGLSYAVDAGGPVYDGLGAPLVPAEGPFDFAEGGMRPQRQFWVDPVTGQFLSGPPGAVGTLPTTSPTPYSNPTVSDVAGSEYVVTEQGQVLTEAFQLFLGQTSIFQWGKALYAPGENGGITGIVQYATTRAEDDPALAVAEPWEPGIARIQVNLYEDLNDDGLVDDHDGNGLIETADVDNHPLGNFPGPEDIDNGTPGVFDLGDAIDVVYTDSWDDNRPVGLMPPSIDPNTPADAALERFMYDSNGDGVGDTEIDGYDGLRAFNQIRPGVFDGGFAFPSDTYAGPTTPLGFMAPGRYIVETAVPPGYEVQREDSKNVVFGDQFIPAEFWKVPGATPPDFAFDATPGIPFIWDYVTMDAQPIACARDYSAGVPGPGTSQVDPLLQLFPASGEATPLWGIDQFYPPQWPVAYDPDGVTPDPLTGKTERLGPEMMQVQLSDGANAAVNFFLFTHVPIAGQFTGFILNDLANEFNPFSPNFGEKWAPPWLPITVRDWEGNIIQRIYSDEFGLYNAMVPGTYNANLPMQSGMSPAMVTVSLNDPGPILDEDPASPTLGQLITDPFFNPKLSQFTYTFDFMPGNTTYLDTPVLPIGAFAGKGKFPVDCEFPDGTPLIHSVNSTVGGPGGPLLVNPVVGGAITITARDTVSVTNPLYGLTGEPQFIDRDYGFGPIQGTVTLDGEPLTITGWNHTAGGIIPDTIQCTVPPRGPGALPYTGQLMITRGDNGVTTPLGLTLTVGLDPGTTYHVVPSGGSIQTAIDAANSGDLVLIEPGTYHELVIMDKPVKLQGYGASSVGINAQQVPNEKIQLWRQSMHQRWIDNHFSLLPAQELNFIALEPTLTPVEGSGIGVYALDAAEVVGAPFSGFGPNTAPRIDGVTVSGASTGGGIFCNGYAYNLEIANCRIVANNGAQHGGIGLGWPNLPITKLVNPGGGEAGGAQLFNLLTWENSRNENVKIHHNLIAGNGTLGFSGGGIAIYSGAHNYEITDNVICGNFSTRDGGGIGHYGLSENGLIARNSIEFNQCFNQGLIASGGGVVVSGAPPSMLNGRFAGLSPGSGSVKIVGNIIHGNNAGAGDGGGIFLNSINGWDGEAWHTEKLDQWYSVDIIDNMITNNVTSLRGGAISMKDAVMVRILNNTIANNDSTATQGSLFQAVAGFPIGTITTARQTAGVVAYRHSEALMGIQQGGVGGGGITAGLEKLVLPVLGEIEDPRKAWTFPLFVNNVVTGHRSFAYQIVTTPTGPTGATLSSFTPLAGLHLNGADPDTPANVISTDFAVVGVDPRPEDPGFEKFFPVNCGLDLDTAQFFGWNLPGYNNVLVTLGLTDTLFVNEVHNSGPGGATTGPGGEIIFPETTTPLPGAAAFDEGGNFVDVTYFPLTRHLPAPTGTIDYHLGAGGLGGIVDLTSSGADLATLTAITDNYGTLQGDYVADIDGHLQGVTVSIGADDGVTPAGTRPIANNATFTIPVADPYTDTIAGLYYDPNGDALTLSLGVTVNHGTLTLDTATGGFTYDPQNGFVGTDSFTYQVSDGALTSIGTVYFDVLPGTENKRPRPVANGINIVGLGGMGSSQIQPNDPNLGDTHTYTLLTAHPAYDANLYGTVDLFTSGRVRFTSDPALGFTPPAGGTIVVNVTDSGGMSAIVRINVNVTPPAAPPATMLQVQLPVDVDPEDMDGDGDRFNDHRYYLITAGDGWSTMADGRQQYLFGFADMTHLLPAAPTFTATMAGMGLVPNQDDPAQQTAWHAAMTGAGNWNGPLVGTFVDHTGTAREIYHGVQDIALRDIMEWGTYAVTLPAPDLSGPEGAKVYANLCNVGMMWRPDLFDAHSIHFHGYPNSAPVYDGVPDDSISIKMQGMLTYYYNLSRPGTYLYHCHVEAMEHMQMGMIGNLWVTPKQDHLAGGITVADGRTFTKFAFDDGDGSTGYDREYNFQLTGFDHMFHDSSRDVQPLPFRQMDTTYPLLNGRGYPQTVQAYGVIGRNPGQSGGFLEKGGAVIPQEHLWVDDPTPGDGVGHICGVGPAGQSPSRRRIWGPAYLSDIHDYYKDMYVVFLGGPGLQAKARGVARKILDYNGTTKRIRFYDGIEGEMLPPLWPLTPALVPGSQGLIGIEFVIVRTVPQWLPSRMEAVQGERILLRVSCVEEVTEFTMTSQLPMQLVGYDSTILRSHLNGGDHDVDEYPFGDFPNATIDYGDYDAGAAGADLPAPNNYFTTNSLDLVGGRVLDVIIDTKDVPPGTYLIHASNKQFLTNDQEPFGGLQTEITVTAPPAAPAP